MTTLTATAKFEKEKLKRHKELKAVTAYRTSKWQDLKGKDYVILAVAEWRKAVGDP